MRLSFARASGAFMIIGALSCARNDKAGGLDVVRIATHGRLSSSVVFIADEEGFFAKEGMRLEFIDSPRSTQALPLLDRGDVDVLGASASSGLYSALAQGARFRIVADRGHFEPDGCDYNAIMGRRGAFTSDSPTAAEVKGKRFSVNPGGTAAYVADMYLQSLGLKLSDVRVVKLNENVEAQALESGALDIMHVAEPFLTKLKSEGHRVLARGGKLAPGGHTSMLLFGPTLLGERRDLAQRFMNAYLRGARQFAEGPTHRNVEIIAKRGGYDADLLRSACFIKVRPDGELSFDWLLAFQQWAVGKGYLTRVAGREAGTDMSFARQAAATLAAESGTK